MAISDYLRGIRAKIGNDLLLVPTVTGLVFDASDRLLLVRHANGAGWGTPGGAVDPDEPPADAVVREVYEETGLHVEPMVLCGVFGGPLFRTRYENGDEAAFTMAVYECRVLGGAPRPDGDETLEVRWCSAAELAALELPRWAREVVLPAVRSNRGRTVIPPVGWRPVHVG
jgi:8-oxo-dGTP pyrophosphatase MutT (NUDIX family)